MRTTRRTATLLLAACALLGAACSGADENPLSEAEVDAGDADGDGDAPTGSTSIELLDPGAEPRQVLRLATQGGCEQRITTSQSVEQEIDGGFGEAQVITTGSEIDQTVRCRAVEADRIEVGTTFDDVRVLEAAPGLEEQLDEMLAGFEGTEQTATYDRRGQALELDFPDAAFDDPLAEQVFDSMMEGIESSSAQAAAPFPEEAIGVGGVWRVTNVIAISGIAGRSVNEYTVTSIGPDHVEAEVRATIEFDPGPFEIDGVPSTGLEIVSGRLEGTGTIRWDLAAVLPTSQQVMEGTLTMSVEDVTLDQHMRQEVAVTAR